jgi:SAM-dependent methyltransferase
MFLHELTPHWLATVTMLAGHRPFDIDRPFRFGWFGSAAVITPAVVAAVHPGAEVVAWSPRPTAVVTARRLGEDAGLDNLVVHDSPVPPSASGGRFDVIVIDGLIDVVDDDARSMLVDAVAELLRPGGTLCVTYRTVAGWGELDPIVRLVRYVAGRTTRDQHHAIAEAISLLESLRDLGAGYLATRPIVRAWVDDLVDCSIEDIFDEYVQQGFRPVSHAQVVGAFAGAGVEFVGSARLDDVVPECVPEALFEQIHAARSVVLRETLGDLAVRRPARADLFMLGGLPVATVERHRWVDELPVTAFGARLAPGGDLGALNTGSEESVPSIDKLAGRVLPVAELWPEAGEAAREAWLRRAMQAGQLHPVLGGACSAEALDGAERLTSVLCEAAAAEKNRYFVTPVLRTAVPMDAGMRVGHRRFLEGR